jgi:hypothetical protein
MYLRVEPSGCAERSGKVQIRFCFYLEPGDYGYGKHHKQVPKIPAAGYPSVKKIQGDTAWLSSLPKVWQTNPFHNHFIYVEADTTDEEILDIGQTYLVDAYAQWQQDKIPVLHNKPLKEAYSNPAAVSAKLNHLKKVKLERHT